MTLGVALDDGGNAFGQLGTGVDDCDVVHDPGYELDVMRHEEDGDSRVPDLGDDALDVPRLCVAHARGRLVQEEKVGLGSQGPRDLKQLPFCPNEIGGQSICRARKTDEVEQL